mmetsp:Transcript_20820/g.59681  ORF Transcript_20820/g.59681 Transcript_20820/m.59681 type:complete len:506 (-) Transcript_20820:678-2195(-)
MARPFKKRRHVFGLDKFITSRTPAAKRARKNDGDSCTDTAPHQHQEPPNKKQKKAVLWSATVPDNQVGKRTIIRKDTPKKRPAAESSNTIEQSSLEKENDARVHFEIDGNRAVAIKSSRLAVDMAKCRASQAGISLERAKRREKQAKAVLLEAANERYLAEQEKEAAAQGTKKAADYLLDVLQGSDVVGTDDTVTCIGMSGKGRSLLERCQSMGTDIYAAVASDEDVPSHTIEQPEARYNPEPSIVASPTIPSRTTKEERSTGDTIGKQAPCISSNDDITLEKTRADDTKVSSLLLKKEQPLPTTAAAAAAEKDPIIENIKDKRIMCPATKRIGSYSGQGRANEETGEFERHGEGCMTIEGCDFIYRGEFAANLRHGHGCELNAKGHGYSGEWRNDVKHGHGSITDEACISGGRFEDGQRVGPHAYHFGDGRACLKNHINNRDLCGPCLSFSACRRYARVCNDGDVEVVKQGMLSFYLDRMKYHANDGTLLRATRFPTCLSAAKE